MHLDMQTTHVVGMQDTDAVWVSSRGEDFMGGHRYLYQHEPIPASSQDQEAFVADPWRG